jgi:Arc/MetJ-type ribon-helix-helix transcriptional regulator
MYMPTSVRLDKQTEARLERMARTTGRTKSDLIREAIVRLDEALTGDGGPALHEQLREYIGAVHLEPSDRARRAEELLREGFGRKKRP